MNSVYKVRVWVRVEKDVRVVARDIYEAREILAQHVNMPSDCEVLDIDIIDIDSVKEGDND